MRIKNECSAEKAQANGSTAAVVPRCGRNNWPVVADPNADLAEMLLASNLDHFLGRVFKSCGQAWIKLSRAEMGAAVCLDVVAPDGRQSLWRRSDIVALQDDSAYIRAHFEISEAGRVDKPRPLWYYMLRRPKGGEMPRPAGSAPGM